ncbi:cytochrome c oxidase assembly protein [Brevundimonas basaltis]|uniref:Putative membrane protein n=1 Tax=Brevundimonas basaltis TaxID=472166 RepID=A0A7W8MIE2_9CAUL|nr:cytochrome c oxidase assembly protein [Brevundimonas basaltis]MBB5292921.1 putative membrane protein [Brevundimonas basaltis]
MIPWLPYCGPGSTPADWAVRWNADPWLIAGLAGLALVILVRGAGVRQSGLAAIAVLAVAFVSPLCALSSALFTARTIHHVLLVAVAAPLIAWSLPRRGARALALATAAQVAAFWAWHAPGAYAAALSSDLAYWAMQASILAPAVWFWAAVRSAAMPAAIIALLASMVAMGLLGALITFAPDALYAPHLFTTRAWGLSPLEDQQAAGLIMWAPAAAIYLAAALLVLGRWIGPERPTARAA